MADRQGEGTTELVPIKEYAELRKRVAIPDTKSKTRKWLLGQIHERMSKIEAYKGQMANLEGLIEMAQDELTELQSRAKMLEQLK